MEDSNTPKSDTIPAAPDLDMLAAVASDLQTLEGIARGLGDGLHELVQRLQTQVQR